MVYFSSWDLSASYMVVVMVCLSYNSYMYSTSPHMVFLVRDLVYDGCNWDKRTIKT